MASPIVPSVDIDISICQAYSGFKEGLEYHRKNLKSVNDQTLATNKKKTQDRDMNSQVYRGTFIQVMATWEKYVQDILKESVEIVNLCLVRQIKEGKQLSPVGDAIFQKSLAHCSLQYRVLDTQQKLDCVTAYKDVLMKKCCRHLLPVFTVRETGINSRFSSIFGLENFHLSHTMVELSPVTFSFRNKESNRNETVSLETPESVEDLLRLFYGARCVYAHGNAEKTFQPGGVLHNFPERDVFIQRIGDSAGDLLYIIYKYAKQYGKTAWVYYHNLVNLQRFILSLAFRLFATISKWVYDVFGERIWNFDPEKVEIATQGVQEDFVQL